MLIRNKDEAVEKRSGGKGFYRKQREIVAISKKVREKGEKV